MEEAIRADNETTAVRLRAILIAKGYSLSLSTLLKSRKLLGRNIGAVLTAKCSDRETKPSVLSERHGFLKGHRLTRRTTPRMIHMFNAQTNIKTGRS